MKQSNIKKKNKKKLEIDQRPKRKEIFGCNCAGSHFVTFTIYDWGDYTEFNVAMIDPPYTVWSRIKNGLKHIFKGGDLYYMDVGLTSEDLDKVKSIIDDYEKLRIVKRQNKK